MKPTKFSLMFPLVLSLLLMMNVAGCLLDSDNKDDKTTEPDTREPVVGEVYVSDEAYKVIGYGYDIFGTYADPTQIKGLVFQSWNLPTEYTVKTQINHSIFATETGSSIQEYQQQLAEAIEVSGSYKVFSGAVKANFTQDYYSLNQTSFATVMGKINSYQIAIPSNYARVELLRPFMADQAARDLDNTSIAPTDIFRMYGTHVLTGAVMGARLDFNVAMRSSDITTGRTVAVLAEAEYSSLFTKVNSSVGFNSDEEKRNYEEHRSLRVNAIGGLSQYAQDIITKSDYDQWIGSIQGHEVFCDYTLSGLIPIWEFCDSTGRRDEIASFYDTWASNHQIYTHDAAQPPRNSILDIQIKNSDNGGSFHQNGLTYYKMDSDLNRGAGGDYIYIYVAVGLDTTTGTYSPITNLVLVNGGGTDCKNSTPSGYTLIDQDLNSGAGGQYIYLCYTRETTYFHDYTYHTRLPIRTLEVWNRSSGSTYSWGGNSSGSFYDVYSENGPNPLDLNKGAGGDYIYLLYSRD